MSPEYPTAGAQVARSSRYSDLPRTFRASDAPDVVQQFLFDPVTVHHGNAYRASDPQFADPAQDRAWRLARSRALHLVLSSIANSVHVDALVLRGSVAMSVWFPESAREPGDLDFVVVPASWGVTDARTAALLAGIADGAETFAARHGEGVTLSAEGAVIGDIWTYDRVPGRRMVLPWSATGLPGGDVQLDFVFNESLPEVPQALELPGGGVIPAASPALSLAWKMLWLVTDAHPQGKDLYDAVLLAERYGLDRELLRKVFEPDLEVPSPADVERVAGWAGLDHFALEYPRLRDLAPGLAGRLVRAVRPAFAERR